jgi:hypothetical protein
MVTFTVKICREEFDSSCCRPPGPYASGCTTLGIQFSASFAGMKWDPKDVKLNTLLDQVTKGLAGMLINLPIGSYPKKACIAPGYKGELKACLKGCGVLVSGEMCIGTSGYTAWTKVGYCGLPSIQLAVSADVKDCR